MLELRSGDHFAGCRIIDICGKGGYGTVYLAEDAVGKLVAVKIINTNRKEQELKGIRNYMPVSHQSPYLLSVYHVGLEQGELFLVMEPADSMKHSGYYLPDTLSKRLQLLGRIPPDEALDMVKKISSAVKTLHDASLIHRDIKPDNIVFVNEEPKLSDPGLICSTDRSITLAGTLGFLPPECFGGSEQNSMQSDVYALGKLFYCIITGEAPGRFPYLPRDISFPACRKLLPILLKACNTKKKKRYASIDEFQRALPAKLPRPGIFLRLEEKFRTWRLMHLLLWRCIVLAIFTGAALAAGILWKRQQDKIELIQLYETLKAERAAFEDKLNSQDKLIALQLMRLTGEKNGRELMKKYTSLPENPKAAVALCRQYQSALNALAMRAANRDKLIPDAIRRAAVRRAFLKSPLGGFLSPEQKEALQKDMQKDEKANRHLLNKALKLEKTFRPNSSGMFEFAYIPPGDFISGTSKKPMRIDYPLWVAPEKLNIRQFSFMCGFSPPGGRDYSSPAVGFLWNDIIYGCMKSYPSFQVVDRFPPGYIVRPLTREEWEYCLALAKSERAPLTDIGGKITEMVSSPGNIRHRDSVIAMTDRPKKPVKEFVFFQTFMKDVGTRIAIAPGDPDFYRKNLRTDTPQHLVHRDRHYEFFGHLCANFKRHDAENICRMLGGRLASLDSPELIEKINRTASPVISYFISVAADFKDGKWYWANGKEIQNAPPPPDEGEHFVLSGTRLIKKRYQNSLGFICEWTGEEYRRQSRRKAGDAVLWPEKHQLRFRIDGKEYLFLRFSSSYPHLFRRYAELLGGKLAEPESAELRNKISNHIKNFDDKPTLLGGYWHNGKIFWATSRNEITEPLPMTGQVLDPAPSLSHPAIHRGKLCSIQFPDRFLVEFPATSSYQK